MTPRRDGSLYFGCDDVISFDGEQWIRNAVPSYAVRALALGENGRLWVGAVNEVGYFDRTEKGLSALPLPRLAVFLRILRAISATSGKSLSTGTEWCSQPRHPCSCGMAASFKVYPMPGARRLVEMQAEGRIFVSHPPSGLWSLDADGPHLFISSQELKYAATLWIEKDAKGWLLCTPTAFVASTTATFPRLRPKQPEFVRRNVLTCACRSPHGDLCIGTLYGGIAVIGPSGAIERVISTDDGLPSRGIYSIFFSDDGALWTTSGVGISRISYESGTTLFDARQGLAGKPCYSAAQRGSEILVATQEGIYGLAAAENSRLVFTRSRIFPEIYRDLEGGRAIPSMLGIQARRPNRRRRSNGNILFEDGRP